MSVLHRVDAPGMGAGMASSRSARSADGTGVSLAQPTETGDVARSADGNRDAARSADGNRDVARSADGNRDIARSADGNRDIARSADGSWDVAGVGNRDVAGVEKVSLPGWRRLVQHSPLAWLLIGFVKGWRAVISPLYGDVCKFYPTCSEYGLVALQTHGAINGSWLIVRRLVRCHPWSLGGVDYVPDKASHAHSWCLDANASNGATSFSPTGSSVDDSIPATQGDR